MKAAVSMIRREVDGRFLCVWNKRYGGWSFPGGLVEEGETPEQAQARELLEECGVYTVHRQLVFCGPATQLPEGEDRANSVWIYRVICDHVQEPREMEVGCAVTWLTRDEFLKWTSFKDLYARVFVYLNDIGDTLGAR